MKRDAHFAAGLCTHYIPGKVARGAGGMAGITPAGFCKRKARVIDAALPHEQYCSQHRGDALKPVEMTI